MSHIEAANFAAEILKTNVTNENLITHHANKVLVNNRLAKKINNYENRFFKGFRNKVKDIFLGKEARIEKENWIRDQKNKLEESIEKAVKDDPTLPEKIKTLRNP